MGAACCSSTSRSIAPAARCTSPHISLSEAAEIATYTAYTRNCPSWPPVISPRTTECAPIHSTNVIAPKTSIVAIAVSVERVFVRRTAATNESSTAASKRREFTSSSVNACTVWIAFNVSSAMPLVSAMRSCDARESLRTRRPSTISGTITTGTSTRIISVSLGLVIASITRLPTSEIAERSVIERFTPAMDCTSVVSAVSRESTSPILVTSKKPGSMRITRA